MNKILKNYITFFIMTIACCTSQVSSTDPNPNVNIVNATNQQANFIVNYWKTQYQSAAMGITKIASVSIPLKLKFRRSINKYKSGFMKLDEKAKASFVSVNFNSNDYTAPSRALDNKVNNYKETYQYYTNVLNQYIKWVQSGENDRDPENKKYLTAFQDAIN